MQFVLGFVALLASAGAVGVRESRDIRESAACRPSTSCHEGSHTSDGFLYKVNGYEIIVDFLDTKYFALWCNSNSREPLVSLSADDPALPAMSRLVTADKVVFKGCVVPKGTYYDALKALNVTGTTKLLLELPAEPKLKIHHLRGLQITNLEITADDPFDPPRPTHDYLDEVPEVPGLRMLKLINVVPEPEALKRLPTTLESLNFVNVRVPAAEWTLRNSSMVMPRWLERLHSLRSLHLVETSAGAAESPGAMLTLPQLATLPNLINATLYHVPLDPNKLSSWLKGSTLKNLVLVSCGLMELPRAMFEGANLTKIILSYNNLTSLPDGLFSPLPWLRELDLSNNQLDRAALVRTVSPLTRLETLKANNNPLGSLCGDNDIIVTKSRSELPVSLRRLELRGTGATRICSDWVNVDDSLIHIDLSNNDIGNLIYSELEMKRTLQERVWLNLSNNPRLHMIEISRSNFNQCIEDAHVMPESPNIFTRVGVELKLSSLACDCGVYWLRETLRYCSLLTINDDVTCAPEPLAPAHATLLAFGPDEIYCPYNDVCLPECSCMKRPRDNATVVKCTKVPLKPRWPPSAPGWPLALHAAPGTLDAVPSVELVELHAPNNNITRLDDKDIADTLRVLDVRNNSIAHISLAAAQLLGRERGVGKNRSMFLTGNRLACECSDAPAFGLLKRVVLDWNTTQCADLSYVSEKTKSELCASPLLTILLGVVVPLLILILAGLILQRLLPHVKQFLFQRNLCLRWILSANDNVNDPEKTHDVFLSYAYDDLERLKELKHGLESRGYTTIEHCRDWQPGDPVMEQIARSVLCARRTLLLVSDNYAKSKWALEEFHAAHAHALERRTARVLIVRCGLHKPEALPSDLQLYLYNNTYLAWDDPDFWYKLCRIMPPLHQDIEPPLPLFKQDIKKSMQLPQEIPLVSRLAIEQRSDTIPCAC